jgi:predicted Fe-Mo cluster-binding NifX family protein
MKICLTALEENLDSKIDVRFGRAKNFIVVDLDEYFLGKEHFEVVGNNQNLNSVNGAGIQSAQNVVNLKVDAVITGNCGPKAFLILKTENIKVFLAKDITIKEALEKYKNSELELLDSANVEGHWL